jgi:hypothetical protein
VLVIATALTLVTEGVAYGAHLVVRAPSVVAFATDGTQFAAWQQTKAGPITVLDVDDGHTEVFADGGCSLENQEESSEAPADGAARFLVRCEGERRVALVDARTGSLQMLNEAGAAGEVEWERVGAFYLEGRADASRCLVTPTEIKKAEEEEYRCIGLYDVATGTVTFRVDTGIANLDRPGAPLICAGLRSRLAFARRHFSSEEPDFAAGWLVTVLGANEGHTVRVRNCRGNQTNLDAHGEARSLELADGVLTWDTSHPGTVTGLREQSTAKLWSYTLASRSLHWVSLPSVSVNDDSNRANRIIGYAAHAGSTLFWIAARVINGEPGPEVESSTVYVERP